MPMLAAVEAAAADSMVVAACAPAAACMPGASLPAGYLQVVFTAPAMPAIIAPRIRSQASRSPADQVIQAARSPAVRAIPVTAAATIARAMATAQPPSAPQQQPARIMAAPATTEIKAATTINTARWFVRSNLRISTSTDTDPGELSGGGPLPPPASR